MDNVRKISIGTITCVALAMCMSLTIFAAAADFSTKLPANQGDVEISTIRKESTVKHFCIRFQSIGKGTDKVCAWAEQPITGYNYSSPYNQVGEGLTSVKYSEVPAVGNNVLLNLDNPVKLSYEVAVTGRWCPH
ncbi:MAG: hypothetical protein K2N51_13220 [Lachnospiraceae bacterium]|nr:hypothetical protein [Lachnospiraceae bacterium]